MDPFVPAIRHRGRPNQDEDWEDESAVRPAAGQDASPERLLALAVLAKAAVDARAEVSGNTPLDIIMQAQAFLAGAGDHAHLLSFWCAVAGLDRTRFVEYAIAQGWAPRRPLVRTVPTRLTEVMIPARRVFYRPTEVWARG